MNHMYTMRIYIMSKAALFVTAKPKGKSLQTSLGGISELAKVDTTGERACVRDCTTCGDTNNIIIIT